MQLKYTKTLHLLHDDSFCSCPFSIHTVICKPNGRLLTVGAYIDTAPKYQMKKYSCTKLRPNKIQIEFSSKLTTSN